MSHAYCLQVPYTQLAEDNLAKSTMQVDDKKPQCPPQIHTTVVLQTILCLPDASTLYWINRLLKRALSFFRCPKNPCSQVEKKTPSQGFSMSSLSILNLITLCGGSFPVHYRKFNSIPDLHPLDVSRTPPNQKCLQILPNVTCRTNSPPIVLVLHTKRKTENFLRSQRKLTI